MRAHLEPVPFRQDEIKPCGICDRGLMHPGNHLGLFWRVRVERLMIDRRAVQRQAGLEDFFGGGRAGAALGRIMGDDRPMAQTLDGPHDLLVCEACLLEKLPALFVATERFGETASERDENAAKAS